MTATAEVVIRKDGEIELPGQVVGAESATYKWAHYARMVTPDTPHRRVFPAALDVCRLAQSAANRVDQPQR